MLIELAISTGRSTEERGFLFIEQSGHQYVPVYGILSSRSIIDNALGHIYPLLLEASQNRSICSSERCLVSGTQRQVNSA